MSIHHARSARLNARQSCPGAVFFLIITCAFLLAACQQEAPAPQPSEFADRVFVNGTVWTAVPGQPAASALATRGERIMFVGDESTAKTLIGPDTMVHDLGGGMLLPGFIDAHAHVLSAGYALNNCDLLGSSDPDEIRRMLEACAREHEYAADEWVKGTRWEMTAFENGSPPKAWLDEIFEGRPAYFADSFEHSAWVSSRALEIAGIDAETPDPPSGRIERDENGQPNGTLRDSAMALVRQHIPPLTAAEMRANLLLGLEETARFGITAFIDPRLEESEAVAYQQVDLEGALSARVVGALNPRENASSRLGEGLWPLLERQSSLESPRFRTHAVKIFADGVIESKTSYMIEPYSDGSNFPPDYTDEELAGLVTRLDAMGLDIHTHAIGDGAIRQALDAYEAARSANGPNANRHVIVHLQIIDPADIPRFGELNVGASFQGLWAYPDPYIYMAYDLVGEERAQRFYPIGSVQRAGGLLLGGSDWDVTSLNPLDAIETMVRRRDPDADDGPELGTGETIDLDTALAMYTRNAAFAMRLENETGTLEAGKRADLVVLDRDLFAIPHTEINDAQVLMTLLDGEIIYSDELR